MLKWWGPLLMGGLGPWPRGGRPPPGGGGRGGGGGGGGGGGRGGGGASWWGAWGHGPFAPPPPLGYGPESANQCSVML
jgi:hypothetical protein